MKQLHFFRIVSQVAICSAFLLSVASTVRVVGADHYLLETSRAANDIRALSHNAPLALVDNLITISVNSPELEFTNKPYKKTWYVAKDGCGPQRDQACTNGPGRGGSRETAWETIGYAIDRMGNGDLLLVEGHARPYVESIRIKGQHAGSANEPKTIRAVPHYKWGYPAVIMPRNESYALYVDTSAYWIFDNIQINCLSGDGSMGLYIAYSDHIALTGSAITRCRNSATEIRGSKHVLVKNNIFYVNRAVEDNNGNSPNDSNGVTINNGSEHVLITGNQAYGNTGDGVQCQGSEQGNPPDQDSRDIIIEGNGLWANDENGVDVKSCERVAIRNNALYGYAKLDKNDKTHCDGVALIVHYSGRSVLIEGNRISDSGVGIEIGNEFMGPVQDVIVRRNVIYNINQFEFVWSETDRRYNCGDGIKIHRVSGADIYHNTLDRIAHSGIRVGSDTYYTGTNSVRVWNNLVANVQANPYQLKKHDKGGALDYTPWNAANLYSEFNIFYKANGTTTFQRDGNAELKFSDWKAQAGPTFDSFIPPSNPNAASFDASSSAKMFVAPPVANGYRLQLESPAINTAFPDASNNGSNQRCQGAPDKGAVESDC